MEEALPANSGVNDAALQKLVDRFIGEGMAAQTASEGLASQTSMSLDAFFAACHTSQVLLHHLRLLLYTGSLYDAQLLRTIFAFLFCLLL